MAALKSKKSKPLSKAESKRQGAELLTRSAVSAQKLARTLDGKRSAALAVGIALVIKAFRESKNEPTGWHALMAASKELADFVITDSRQFTKEQHARARMIEPVKNEAIGEATNA